ncbi:hypothetical protein ACOMHN_037085 [Nucella lapillus]
MIQTFGWSRYTGYPFMDSCVKLHVPENHVAMISLVSIDLDLQRNQMDCADYLFIDNSGKCSAHDDNRNAICQMQDLRPTVINGHMILSFRFKSDRGSFWLKPGFRLLYSFHKRSEEPEQLPDGQWNCSVPYYASFQMHFVCMDESFCSNRSIEVKCPQHEGMCGFKSIPFGGSCYRFMKPAQRTWVDASDACVHHGGRLAVFNTASTWTNTSAFLQEINPAKRSLFIGLRMAPSVTLPEMYQDCWFWSDNTLAVYLPFKLANVESPYCAIFDDKILDTISCNSIVNAAVLCETTSTSDHAVNDTDVTVVTSSTWMMDNMTTCRHGHTTHTFLACDISTNCSAMSQDEVLPCSNGFSPPVPFFTCRNQMGRVPYTLVCDFRSDCCDGSDEDFCQLPTCGSRREFECSDGKQCVHRDRVCDKRSDCVDGSDEMKCRDILTASDVPVNFIDPPARVDFTGRGSFTVTKLHNTCSETHFQCPGEGYCLPVYVRCNRVNDCPGKEDEKNCDHYTCPGFYRCRHSKICLHRQHLCDGVFQCPQHDDEWLCNVTCPDTCHCYGHAFICTGSFTADTYPELRYVDASGTGMTPANFLNNTKLINLNLRHCKLTSLGLLDFPNLHNLDLSYNNIRELDSNRLYFGNYRWNDAVWKHSVACKLAGFLSLVSSEVSAFLISLITLERALVISFPYKNLRFSQESAHAASMAVWLIGMVLGLIPLLPMTSNWNFYSQSGICVPLPITRKQFGGSGYAFGVIIILNFVLFLFIAVGQFLIYWSIRRNTIGCSDNKRKSRDMAIARRLLAVVLTDFMCWFPIGLLGMMARSGVPISGEINVAIAIFVLPFNSALNPFLYTLNVVRERRQKMANIQKSQIKDENRTRVFDVVSERRRKENT